MAKTNSSDHNQQFLIETEKLLELDAAQLSNGHRQPALDHLEKVGGLQNPSAELTSKCKQLFERLHSIDSEQVRLCMELLGKDPKKTQLRAFAHKNHPNKAQVGPRKGQLNLKNLRPPEKWQQEGRGLYFVVNEGGDKAAEITSCVACFFELDGLTKEQQESRISKFPELKDLIGLTVATREGDDGSLHSYFLPGGARHRRLALAVAAVAVNPAVQVR